MKVKLKLLIAILTILVSLGTISYALASEIVGTWEMKESDEYGEIFFAVTFFDNGILESKVEGSYREEDGSVTEIPPEIDEFHYEIKGSVIRSWQEGDVDVEEIEFKVEGDTLTLYPPEGDGIDPLILKRVK